MTKTHLVGGFNLFEINILYSQNVNLPQLGVENIKTLKPPPRHCHIILDLLGHHVWKVSKKNIP